MKKAALSIIILGTLLTGCIFAPSKTGNDKTVLARVETKPILASDLDSIAISENTIITDSTDVAAVKMKLLNALIDQKIIGLLQDSIAAAMENDPEFKEGREREISNVVFRQLYEDLVTNVVKIDSAQIDSFYQANLEKYKRSEQVKAAHILIPPPSPDTANMKSDTEKQQLIDQIDKDTYERALGVYQKAIAGENWDSLVVKYSQDGLNNKKGGDLGTFGRGRMVASFDSAAFAAGAGEIVGPVKTKFGYHIIKVNEKISEGYRDLDTTLRTEIRGQMAGAAEQTRSNVVLDSLRAGASYIFNDEVLAQEDSLVSPDTWVMVVNSTDTVFESRMQKDFPKYLRFKKIETWTPDDKRAMLKEISSTYLLRAHGKKLGYYDLPRAIEAKDSYTATEAGIRAKNHLRNLEYKPTDEEIEHYYQVHFADLYQERKPLHVLHIIFSDSILAAAIRDSLVAGADFKEMALKYYPGEPEIREVAYDLGFISEEELGQEFFGYAKALKVGEVSVPFKTDWGYHVIKLVDRREDKKLDQVRVSVRKALTEAADQIVRDKYISEKRQASVINIDETTVKKYKFPKSLSSIEIAP